MSTLKEIEERQQRMYRLIDQMQAEEDMNRMLQIVQQLEGEANELQKATLSFQDKMEKQYARAGKKAAKFEVVLTREQRERVMKETGVAMTTVWIDDDSGGRNEAMPATHPSQILIEALRQARAMKSDEPARKEAQKQVDEALADVEAGGPLYAQLVAQVKQDPRFMDAIDTNKKIKI